MAEGKDPDNVRDLSHERSWRFETSGYDPRKFYLKSGDDKGHSEWVRCRIPPHVFDQLAYHASKESPFPYRNVNDFVRDALVHRLATLAEMSPDHILDEFHHLLSDITWQDKIAAEDKIRKWTQDVRNLIDGIVTDFLERDQPDVGIERLDYWLEEIPNTDLAHHTYIRSYIKQKKMQLRDAVIEKREGRKK